MSTALALRDDQISWDDRQLATLRAIGQDKTPDADLEVFFAYCQRAQLDPFTKQIYFIGREDRKAGTTKFTVQVSIDGFRLIARRAAAKAGDSIAYEDTLWCGQDGVWHDVWLSDKPPAAAKFAVRRGDSRFSAIALYREYAQTFRDGNPVGLWGTRPAGQLAKCGEALGLRMAFPNDLSGMYTSDEMGHVDAVPVAESRTVQPPVVPAKPVRLADRARAAKKPAEVPLRAEEPVEAEIVEEQVPDSLVLADEPRTEAQSKALFAMLGSHGVKDRDDVFQVIALVVDRPLESTKDLTKAEASLLLKELPGRLLDAAGDEHGDRNNQGPADAEHAFTEDVQR